MREEVRRALAGVAEGGPKGVRAELEKGVLRHVSVQHLYARLGARLAPGCSEADVLGALHPTPAAWELSTRTTQSHAFVLSYAFIRLSQPSHHRCFLTVLQTTCTPQFKKKTSECTRI